MPSLVEDSWINGQTVTHDLTELEDCSIAIDATYYLRLFLDNRPYHEPLLPALGGLTGIQTHLERDLELWAESRITPFFIFDGQVIVGQDDVTARRGRQAIEKTNQAWTLYFNGNAMEAVETFGANLGAYRPQQLYPMLQNLLKKKGLHFLVAPFKAAGQMAYFEMIDSDQCAAIMGSQELLLYPIKDIVIRSIDWDGKTVTSISKKKIVKDLNVSESMLIDALLMTGTTFLSPFPPLQNTAINPRQPSTIMDAVNMLRTSEKSVTTACNSFSDILEAQDPEWLDKYRKARLAVNHFIYIAENGDIKVNDYDRLTGDNHVYLGLQLPAELFHYVNTGLIRPHVLSWITHSEIYVLPTLDGVASEEYRKLVTNQLVPIKEQALSLLIPRLHRGIQHGNNITMKVWYDEKFSYSINFRNLQAPPTQRVNTWDVKEAKRKDFFPQGLSGSIAFEVLSLRNPDFAKSTISNGRIKGIDSADNILSIVIWRFLHLRGYINESHELTPWGSALAKSLAAMEPTVKNNPDVPGLYEAILVGFELVRFELLNARNRHEELNGFPISGSEDDKNSLLLISRCGTLLKLRHEANGYTGPLSKNLLAFHSLASEVRETDRDLVEAIVGSMLLHAQSKRDRDDYLAIGHTLPFLFDPDIALGIAVKTFVDELSPSDTAEQKEAKIADFPEKYVPFATHFKEDLEICYSFVEAMYTGVKSLDKELPTVDKTAWDKAYQFLKQRR